MRVRPLKLVPYPVACHVLAARRSANIDNLESLIAFYSPLVNHAPHKLRPRYANSALAEPPLKVRAQRDPAASQPQIDAQGAAHDWPSPYLKSQLPIGPASGTTIGEGPRTASVAVEALVPSPSPIGDPQLAFVLQRERTGTRPSAAKIGK